MRTFPQGSARASTVRTMMSAWRPGSRARASVARRDSPAGSSGRLAQHVGHPAHDPGRRCGSTGPRSQASPTRSRKMPAHFHAEGADERRPAMVASNVNRGRGHTRAQRRRVARGRVCTVGDRASCEQAGSRSSSTASLARPQDLGGALGGRPGLAQVPEELEEGASDARTVISARSPCGPRPSGSLSYAKAACARTASQPRRVGDRGARSCDAPLANLRTGPAPHCSPSRNFPSSGTKAHGPGREAQRRPPVSSSVPGQSWRDLRCRAVSSRCGTGRCWRLVVHPSRQLPYLVGAKASSRSKR